MRAAFLGVIGLLATSRGIQAQTYANFGDPRLKDVVEKALENNPGVWRAFGEHEAALQWIPQLHFLPEPMVGVTQYGRSPETRVGPRNTMLRGGGRRNWAKKVAAGGSNRPVRPAPGKSGKPPNNPDASLLQARAYQEVCLDAELTLRMETHQEGSNLE